MIVGSMKIQLYASWVHSLKEKRMEIKSLLTKLRNRFHVSACEVEQQDIHQTLVIGIAYVAATVSQADSICDHILNFLDSTTEAEIIEIQKEYY